MADFATQFPILFSLFSDYGRTTGLAGAIRGIDISALHCEYDGLRQAAPRRADRGKQYFVGHDGMLPKNSASDRREEHLAIALWRLKQTWPRAGGGHQCLLDYQFPLKARRSDGGIGKVDLLGATDAGRLAIIELKVRPAGSGRGDTPLGALMEGLRYAAVVQANHGAIAAEAKDRFGIDLPADPPPIVQILAPKDWWQGWTGMTGRARTAAGQWEPEFLNQVQNRIGICVECMYLVGGDPKCIAWDTHGPHLLQAPTMHPVW